MMLDWDDYQKELLTKIGEIGKLSPDTLHGYQRSAMLARRRESWMRRRGN